MKRKYEKRLKAAFDVLQIELDWVAELYFEHLN
jgi:hypothetical protein